jgi:hypothetical protein
VTRTGRSLIGVFGAVLAAGVVWDQIEMRSLARDIGAIAARGELISVPDRESVELTAGQREAARWYAGAAERARDAARQDGSRVGRVDVDSVVPADLTALELRYPPAAPALQMLDRATPMDFKEFGSEAPELYRDPSPLSDLLSLNDVRADLLAARGRGDEAANTLIGSARLLRTIRPVYSRNAVSAHLLGSVRILLRHTKPGEAALANLQREIAAAGEADSLPRDVQEQRAAFIDRLGDPASSPMEAVVTRVLRPWRARAARQRLAAYRDALALATTPWPARLSAGRDYEARYAPILQDARQARPSMVSRLFNPYGLPIVIVPYNQPGVELASRRVIVAALAIERYRRAHADRPPASLAELVPAYLAAVPVDPFTGAPLIYRSTPEAYLVYSAETDGADSGGLFFGRGSRQQMVPRAGQPRDLGIRVELR